MRDSEKYAAKFWTEIANHYNQAVIQGRSDIAVVLSLKNQEAILRMGDRKSIARELDGLQSGNIAATTLANEKPPEGTFPLIVIMDEGMSDMRIDFLYSVKPEAPPISYGQRVYRASRERTEVEYLRAIKRGVTDPVVLVDTRNQDERKERIEAKRPMPENMEVAHTTITIGTRRDVAAEVGKLSRGAAEWIMEGPLPDNPFTVVVIGNGTAEVFNEPIPVAG
jgi:hypothetical protein